MAKSTKDIWNDNDGEAARSPKKRRTWWLPAVILLVVLGVVLVAAYRDGTGFDVLRRYFNYGSVESVGGETLYTYDAASSNRFAVLGDCLVVLSDTRLRVLDDQGGEVWSTAVSMSAPALSQGGDRAVAYDVGGTALYVVDKDGEVFSFTASESEPLISATLNENGYLAVTAGLQSYKGGVHVYDQAMSEVFLFRSGEHFVADAYVTDDNKYLAAVTLGQEDGVFVSSIVLYDLTQEEPVASYDVSDGLVLSIGQQGSRLVTVSDTCLTLGGTDGEIAGTYSYGGLYLREYDAHGDDFTALLLNRYQSGSVGKLVTVGTDGTELASLDVDREVLDVAAAGRYLAVLYDDSLVIYNRELQVYATLNGTDLATGVLLRTDGSAVLLSSASAGMFLP
jgi:hypothetical protein